MTRCTSTQRRASGLRWVPSRASFAGKSIMYSDSNAFLLPAPLLFTICERGCNVMAACTLGVCCEIPTPMILLPTGRVCDDCWCLFVQVFTSVTTYLSGFALRNGLQECVWTQERGGTLILRCRCRLGRVGQRQESRVHLYVEA